MTENSKLERLTRILHGMAMTLGLPMWKDIPEGEPESVLLEVEKALNAKTLAAFVRGQRAARVVGGEEPDAVPDHAPGDFLADYLEAQEEWSAYRAAASWWREGGRIGYATGRGVKYACA